MRGYKPLSVYAEADFVGRSVCNYRGAVRRPLQETHLLGAVVIERRAEELKRLTLGGAQRQIALQEGRRLVRVLVHAPLNALAADLAQPAL